MAAPTQAPARALVARIDARLKLPREVFARHCPSLCPKCSRPCCVRISRRGLIDTSDLILMAALAPEGLPYPSARMRGCPFLEVGGCALPWNARPYACLHYVCPHLRRAMTHAETMAVEQALVKVGNLRSELVGAYSEGKR
ncbi:MAG: hypothetical protein KQH53_07190 [Desulfarculaceae bacterium]|nr:hypothetical protein [Desulfarculaceae bacterium]